MSNKEIAEKLGFSTGTVQAKASQLGLKKRCAWKNGKKIRDWTAEEVNYLKEYYPSNSTERIAEHLKRSKQGVYAKARELGIEKKKWWSKEEEKFLKENYGRMSTKELAERLGRSRVSIKHKVSRLGLAEQKREARSISINPFRRKSTLS